VAHAQAAFLDRLNAYKRAVSSPQVVDLAPSQRTHNAQARLFRNGLSVVGFALLEDFLRSRSAEVLRWMSNQSLAYTSLPSKLQRAITNETVRALAPQYDFAKRRGANLPRFLGEVGAALASLATPSTVFSPFALGYRGSNLRTDEVGDMLGAFEVVDGWSNIERLAGRIGVGSLTVRTSFDNALQSRHVAAHQATANIHPTDLQYFARDALGIALAFDAVVSRAARLVASGGSGAVTTGLLQDSIRVRFLAKDGTFWRERLDTSSSTIRRDRQFSRLQAAARKRAAARRDLIVVLDQFGSPYRWITTDLP
jgi:hypothetical protein